jgi:hypothetical protein
LIGLPGLHPDIDSGNLRRLDTEKICQAWGYLPELGGNRPTAGVDDDSPQLEVGNPRLSRQRRRGFEAALEPQQAPRMTGKPGKPGVGRKTVF